MKQEGMDLQVKRLLCLSCKMYTYFLFKKPGKMYSILWVLERLGFGKHIPQHLENQRVTGISPPHYHIIFLPSFLLVLFQMILLRTNQSLDLTKYSPHPCPQHRFKNSFCAPHNSKSMPVLITKTNKNIVLMTWLISIECCLVTFHWEGQSPPPSESLELTPSYK